MIVLEKNRGMPESFEPRERCHHETIALVEATTKGSILPAPDTINTYTYKCADCGCVLKGKWEDPQKARVEKAVELMRRDLEKWDAERLSR